MAVFNPTDIFWNQLLLFLVLASLCLAPHSANQTPRTLLILDSAPQHTGISMFHARRPTLVIVHLHSSWNRLPATIWLSWLCRISRTNWKLTFLMDCFFPFPVISNTDELDSMLRSLRYYHYSLAADTTTAEYLAQKNWIPVVERHALVCTLLSGVYIHHESKKQYTLLMSCLHAWSPISLLIHNLGIM